MTDKIESVNASLTANAHVQRASTLLSHGVETPLFACLDVPDKCCFTCCCPCIVEAFTRARLDGRECTPLDALCLSSAYANRQSMRQKYNMGFAEIPDCAAALCCSCCFSVQTARELARKMGDEPVFFSTAVKANLMGDRNNEDTSSAANVHESDEAEQEKEKKIPETVTMAPAAANETVDLQDDERKQSM